MINHLLSASILLVAVLVIRGIFGKHMSQRVKYALWLLVAVKFMLPVSLPESPVSIYNLLDYGMEYAQQAKEMITETKETKTFENNMESTKTLQQTSNSEAEETTNLTEAENVTNNEWNEKKEYITEDGEKKQEETELVNTNEEKQEAKDVGQLLLIIWVIGTCLVGGFFIISNLYYSNRLKKYSILDDTVQGPCKVYVCDKVESPCLAGVFRPVIYLTKECYETEEIKKYILAHEQEHYYHLDHIWNLIRSMCLACYWFHPLVWIGVMLSKKDSELACDEGVLARLGEQERKAYGNTLIFMAAKESSIGGYFTVAAGMAGGKKEMKERVEQITKRKKHFVWMGILAVLSLLVVGISVFSRKNTSFEVVETQYENSHDFTKEELLKRNVSKSVIKIITGKTDDVEKYEIVLKNGKFQEENMEEQFATFCANRDTTRQLVIYRMNEETKEQVGILVYDGYHYSFVSCEKKEETKFKKWNNLQLLAGEETEEGIPFTVVLANDTYTYETLKETDGTRTDLEKKYPHYFIFSSVAAKDGYYSKNWCTGLTSFVVWRCYGDDTGETNMLEIKDGVLVSDEIIFGDFMMYLKERFWRKSYQIQIMDTTKGARNISQMMLIGGGWDVSDEIYCDISTYKLRSDYCTYGTSKTKENYYMELYYNPTSEEYSLALSEEPCSQQDYEFYLNEDSTWAKEQLEKLEVICTFKRES